MTEGVVTRLRRFELYNKLKFEGRALWHALKCYIFLPAI